MMKKTGLLTVCFVFCFLYLCALAQTIEKSENINDGIKELGSGFQVFPVNKPGNTLYKDKKKIISRENLILKDIVESPDGYVYYGVSEQGEDQLGYVGAPGSRFEKIDGEFYSLVAENGKKKLYWINGDEQIQNLLPTSNTATGLVYNKEEKAAFYHITKGETIETEEGVRFQYTFRIHVLKMDTGRVVDLPETVSDFRSRLVLNWADRNTLEYTLSTGRKESIVIR